MVGILAGAGSVMVVEEQYLVPLVAAGEDIERVTLRASPQFVQEAVTPGHVPVLAGRKVQAEPRRYGGHRLASFKRADIAHNRHNGKDYNKGENNQRFHFSVLLI